MELLDLVVEGDTLVVTHIDRLSRGLTHGLQVIEGLHRAGVEFRYPLETMLELHRQHESVILLDHHETARDALEGRMPDCHFDLERSGVTIAGEYWGSGFSTNEGELLARYIEDRDLWRWKLPDSREVSAALDSHPKRFRVWDRLDVETLAREGTGILRYIRTQVENLASICHCSRNRSISLTPIASPSLTPKQANPIPHQIYRIALRISPWLWFRKLVSQRGRVVSLRSGLSGSILFRVTDSDPASGHHYECSHPH